MSTLSEFMAHGARPGREREKRRARSTSPGPVVVLKGWRERMNKVGVTLLLRAHGVSLAEAYNATDGILQGRAVSVPLPAGTDVEALRREIEKLGVIT